MTTTLPARATGGVQTPLSDVPRPEYPRPHFDRSHSWQSLNGVWDFQRGSAPAAQRISESILVPFAWETPRSGIGAHWLEDARYRRTFTVPEEWTGQRIVLHFGAVHHAATVSVNGIVVGTHVGGYVPFEFDITDALGAPTAPADSPEAHAEPEARALHIGEHELVVGVSAPNDKRWIAHGKQRSTPRDDYDSCAFTPSSGIWQPVWLEARPATYLDDLALQATENLDGLVIAGRVAGPGRDSARILVSVLEDHVHGRSGVVTTIEATSEELEGGITAALAAPRLWSPTDPHLYRVVVDVVYAGSADHVESETGLRSIRTRDGKVYLNGQRISIRGVLDQGYWPETGITAPDDRSFVRDLEIARDAGFNLVRKHLKLEDPRFHHHADRMGMLVWAEPASTGRFSADSAAAFEAQIAPMVHRDGNHPSIVIWGLYNEEWGLDWALPEDPAKQEAVIRARQMLRSLDPSRPAVDNSGWTHIDSDLIDWHVYDEHPAGWARKVAELVRDDDPSFPVAIAVDVIVDKRLMVDGPVPRQVPFINSEFGGGWTSIDRGWNLHWQTQELRRHDSVAGWVWTELNDIEHESAGFVAADRTMKDHGGRPPRYANGETATVFDISPEAPGRDVVTATGSVEFGVHVSHHGVSPVTVTVEAAWGSVFSEEPDVTDGAPVIVDTVDVEPFILSAPVTVATTLPRRVPSARLHVFLRLADGTVLGRGAVDIVRG
ncbi:glycoside hydrolase family 2 protein [Curtobacterium ammoniigenes]|uniref:glycoside hydrolase family 2 protein n=1 Tax=Curtobacterium ammoniigenes TaxID=395387 RepID=UPI00083528FA|nr:glycoside hydrolase family 2 [Curtobacterium ammoniigenes]